MNVNLLQQIMKKIILIVFAVINTTILNSQTSVIKGSVKDATNNEIIPFANVFIEQINSGVATDFNGNYKLENLNPGLYTVKCSFVGYDPVTISEIIVNPNKPTILDFKLIESSTSLEVVEITASPFQKVKKVLLAKEVSMQLKYIEIRVEIEIFLK